MPRRFAENLVFIEKPAAPWAASILAVAGFLSYASGVTAAEGPTVEFAMGIKPVHQAEVEYDIPAKKDYAACKLTTVREGKSVGYVLLGTEGQILRRFIDTDGVGGIDQWSYFRNGIEVYRDIDTNNNRKVDQTRWLNLGGSRWGIDENEDGIIDAWKVISAEEVSRVVVSALRTGNARLLEPLLITQREIKALGIRDEIEAKLLEAVDKPAARLKAIVDGSKVLTPKMTWLKFDSSAPSVVPAEQSRGTKDLYVYENVMAIFDPGNGGQPGLIHLGEVIRIGEVWKLTSIPYPLEGKDVQIAEIGLLMQPDVGPQIAVSGANAPGTLSPQIEKLIKELEAWDKRAPGAEGQAGDQAKHTEGRIAILKKLFDASNTPEEHEQWSTQIAEALAAGVQAGLFPKGVEEIASLQELVKKTVKTPANMPHLEYLRIVADYSRSMQKADNDDRRKVQEKWLTTLETYIAEYPKSDDSPEAVLQLGNGYEFVGKMDKAREWYQRLVQDFPESQAKPRGLGALRRLTMVGKPLNFSAQTLSGDKIDLAHFRGQVVAIHFWASWSETSVADIQQLKAAYNEYRAKGFEIVGISLDQAIEPVTAFVKRAGVAWPQVFEPGGLDSKYAVDFGIIYPPTMFLIGPDGKVANRNASVADVRNLLSETYDKEKPAGKDDDKVADRPKAAGKN